MAGPAEIMIVVGVFGLVAMYLYIVHRFMDGVKTQGASTALPAEKSVQRDSSKLVTAH